MANKTLENLGERLDKTQAIQNDFDARIEKLLTTQEKNQAKQNEFDVRIEKLLTAQEKTEIDIDNLLLVQEKLLATNEKSKFDIESLFTHLKESSLEFSNRIEKTEKLLKEVSNQLGGMGNRHGKFAENFFFHALEEKMKLGDVKFDEIEQNMRHKRKNIVDEFDIVLYNGNSVGIVEIKYCVESKHIKRLCTQKTENFKWLYPEYQDYNIYLGIAGMSFENEGVLAEAQEAGIATLEAKGDYVEISAQHLLAY